MKELPTGTRVCIVWSAAGLSLLCAATLCGQDVPEQDVAGKPQEITLAMNAFGTVFARGEPVPLLIAEGSSGRESLYVRHWDRHFIKVLNESGEQMIGAAGDTPGPPPGEWYAEVNGKSILLTPLHELRPGGGYVQVMSDALAAYPDLPPGRYTLSALTTAVIFPPEVVLRREGVSVPDWAPPESASRRFSLESNRITVEIR